MRFGAASDQIVFGSNRSRRVGFLGIAAARHGDRMDLRRAATSGSSRGAAVRSLARPSDGHAVACRLACRPNALRLTGGAPREPADAMASADRRSEPATMGRRAFSRAALG